MARDRYPSDEADRHLLRFPPGVKERLTAVAKANNRSANSEIVKRLIESLAMDDAGTERVASATIGAAPGGEMLAAVAELVANRVLDRVLPAIEAKGTAIEAGPVLDALIAALQYARRR